MLSKRYAFSHEPVAFLDGNGRRAKEEVERKIGSGIYQLEEAPCFCGNTEYVTLAERDRYGFNTCTVICTVCGLIRTNPRMTADSYGQFYDSEYRAIYSKGRDRQQHWRSQLSKGEGIFKFVSRSIEDTSFGVVFEIGCGMGGILAAFHRRGSTIAGVDYGSESIEYGRTRLGVNTLFAGDSARLASCPEKADLVILSDVIEHFLDLGDELSKIRKLMKPNAYLYVSTPGIRSIHRGRGDFLKYLQNAHTFYFDLTTLSYVMECVGFELVTGNESVESLFQTGDSSRPRADVPKDEYRRMTTYLKRMETLRRLGYRPPAQIYSRLRHLALQTLEMLGVEDRIRRAKE